MYEISKTVRLFKTSISSSQLAYNNSIRNSVSKHDGIRFPTVTSSDGIQGVRANLFLECRDNQRTRSCFIL